MKLDIKKILLGEIGAGILLIILNIMGGFEIKENIFATLGYNFLSLFGIASIIDGIRKIKSEQKNK